MSALDIAIVLVYFAVVLGVGLFFRRRQQSTEDYFLGSRSIPGWVVGFSVIGTMIGSTTFVGHPAAVFQEDMWNLPFFMALPVVMYFVSRYIVTLYRHRIRMSVYQYLELRLGYPARAYGAVAFLGSRVVDVSSTLFFLGIAVAYLTDVDVRWVIAFVGVMTLAYTLLGGIAAIAWADVLQSVLLLGGGLTVMFVAYFGADAGAGATIRSAWEGGRFGTGDWTPALDTLNAWMLLVGGTIWALQRYAVDQHLVQRYLVARSDREARRATFTGAVACVPIWVMFMLIGAGIWGFYQTSGVALPPEVLADSDTIAPHFIRTQCPGGLLGLIVAALAAAAMSSLGADLNSVATVTVDDFYARFRPDSTDAERLRFGRLVVLAVGSAAILLATQWVGVESAIEFGVKLLSISTAGLLGLFALGLLTTRGNRTGAWAGILVCVVFTAWATLTSVTLPAMEGPLLDLGAWNYPYEPYLIGILNHLLLFGVGYLVSLFSRRRENVEGLSVWSM